MIKDMQTLVQLLANALGFDVFQREATGVKIAKVELEVMIESNKKSLEQQLQQNTQLSPKQKEKYKNPRNLCSGSVRQLNNEITAKRNVNFFAFSLVKAEGVDFENSHEKQMLWLKGQGFDILSTHNGYIIQKSPLKERVFKVKHTTMQTEDELTTIVELGGTVVDVFVWHRVYGRIEAALNIFSPLQIKQFIEGVRSGKSTELMNVTGGYHYHTVRAGSIEILDKIGEALEKKKYIVKEI